VAAVIYLDTHVVAWLYAGMTDRLPQRVQEALEQEDLLVSPIVGLELQYLYEIGRVSVAGAAVLEDLKRRIGLSICDKPFTDVAAAAHALSWTRDPFDRLIVAQAALKGTPLATKDATIRERYSSAFWEGK
jgi:PIN domain nuclease of toxin-antitoxin system